MARSPSAVWHPPWWAGRFWDDRNEPFGTVALDGARTPRSPARRWIVTFRLHI